MIIYILELNENKYYIGKSDNSDIRIKDYCLSNGSSWTKKYKPLNLIEKYETNDKFDEDKYVKKYMMKYGIDNVRGGSYSQMILSDETIEFLNKELYLASDKCFTCGFSTHFTKECRGVKIETMYNELTDNSEINTDTPLILEDIQKIYYVEQYVSYYVKLHTLPLYYINRQKEALTSIINRLTATEENLVKLMCSNDIIQYNLVSTIRYYHKIIEYIKLIIKILDEPSLDEYDIYNKYDNIFRHLIFGSKPGAIDQFYESELINSNLEKRMTL